MQPRIINSSDEQVEGRAESGPSPFDIFLSALKFKDGVMQNINKLQDSRTAVLTYRPSKENPAMITGELKVSGRWVAVCWSTDNTWTNDIEKAKWFDDAQKADYWCRKLRIKYTKYVKRIFLIGRKETTNAPSQAS